MAARAARLRAVPGLAGRAQLAAGTHLLVVEQSPALTAAEHDRRRPGLNHLAFHAGTRGDVDSLAADGPAHGWTLLFADKHPYAGGPEHYAAYLASTDGFEVELVADYAAPPTSRYVATSPRRGGRAGPPGRAWRAARPG